MTYKPIELRPLGGRAERKEDNVGCAGVNALVGGNRRHRRRVPLSVWIAVAVLVLVLFGCIATIAYVNLSGDALDKEKEEEGSNVEGSWAVVLAGRGDTSALNRHVEVVDLGEGCKTSPPHLSHLPQSLNSSDILKSSFQPEEGILVCGNPPGSCFLLSPDSSRWNPTNPENAPKWKLKESESEKSSRAPEGRAGSTILRTEKGTYMLGGSRADGQLAQTVLKWDPGVKRWQEGKGFLKEGRINPAVIALPCSFQSLPKAPPKFHRLLDMKPFT